MTEERRNYDVAGNLTCLARVEPSYEVYQRPVTAVGPNRSETMTRRTYHSITFPGCMAELAIATESRVSSGEVIFNSLGVVEPPIILAEGTKKWFDSIQ